MDTDTAVSVLDIVLAVVTPVLVWLGARASKWVSALALNEKTGGMLARLNDSVFTAVKTVNQTLRAEIKAAKDPSSPGGSKITKEEAEQLKAAAWDELRAYWGAKGLEEAGKVLGLDNLTRFVDGKIESAVSDLNASSPNP